MYIKREYTCRQSVGVYRTPGVSTQRETVRVIPRIIPYGHKTRHRNNGLRTCPISELLVGVAQGHPPSGTNHVVCFEVCLAESDTSP